MDKERKETTGGQQFVTMSLILDTKQRQRFSAIRKAKDLCGDITVLGKGTVKSTTLNLLGIRSQKREIVSILLEKEKAKELLNYLEKEFMLHEAGKGIAYIVPVTTAEQIINRQQYDSEKTKGLEETREKMSMYKKLTVIVNRGMAETVIDSAQKFGVKGGTVINGRGSNSECAAKVFGIEIEPEKEVVIMILPETLVETVVKGIFNELQMELPGNGILFIEPILDVRGLFDSDSDK